MKTKTKRIIYLYLSTVMGLLVGIIVWAVAEIKYIIWSLNNGTYPVSDWNTQLMTILLWIAFAIFGYLVGLWWWRIVYVEHRHWRRRLWRKK